MRLRRRQRVKVTVSDEPVEDRTRAGTKAERRDHMPLGVKVRYSMIMAALLTVGIGAYIAWHNTQKLSSQGRAQATQAAIQAAQQIQIAIVTVTNTGLAQRNSALGHRIARDEHRTCVIQRRGLPAGHQLAASMIDIHKLLTLPPASAAQQLAAQNTPPAVRAIVSDLNRHLTKYTSREAKQPQTRRC